MKLVSKRCPNCGNQKLEVSRNRKHCECKYCGSKYVIDWSDSGGPQFSSFDSILQKTVTTTQFMGAHTRLIYIEDDIENAQGLVVDRRKRLRQAESQYNSLARDCKENLKSAELKFWAAVAAAVVAWYLVIFILEGSEWWGVLVVGIGAIVAAVSLYREWKKAEQQLPGTLRVARKKVDEADRHLSEALTNVEDLLLERELCEKKVKNYRYTDLDDDPSD